MASTTFVNHQTVVEASWLNDVNTGIYKATSGIPGTINRTLLSKLSDIVSASDFGVVADGVTDDTAALYNCLSTVYDSGGGTVMLPDGDIVCNNLVFTYANNETTLNLRGQGKQRTRLVKTTADSNPVIQFKSSSATLPVSTHSELADFSVIGNNKLGSGLRTTLMARFTLRNIGGQGCSIGFDNQGSLIFTTYDCDWMYNTHGYVSRKEASTRCNAINFVGGSVVGNTGYGYDIGDAASMTIYGTDIESNGTLGITTSGDGVIRSTVDDETGSSQISLIDTWHEANTGKGFTVEAASGLLLTFKNVRFDSNASGTSFNVGAISTLTLEQVHANNTANNSSTVCNIIGGSFTVLNDASVYNNYLNASSNSGLVVFNSKVGALGGLSVDNVGVVRVGPAAFISTGDVTVKGGNTLLTTSTNLVNGSAANTATLTNSPRTGNPDKWIQINDNGVTRLIPTWSI